MSRPFAFCINRLPVDERDTANHIDFLLSNMDSFFRQFHAALWLSIDCHNQAVALKRQVTSSTAPAIKQQTEAAIQVMRDRQQIALRDSIMTTYHFGTVFAVLRHKDLSACKILRSAIDAKALKLEYDLWAKSRFPDWEGIRHATAHFGELFSTPEDQAKNSIDGPYASAIIEIESGVKNASFHVTSEQEIYITWATLKGRRCVVSGRLNNEVFYNMNRTYQSVIAIYTLASTKIQ